MNVLVKIDKRDTVERKKALQDIILFKVIGWRLHYFPTWLSLPELSRRGR